MVGAGTDESGQGTPGEGTGKSGHTPWDAAYKTLFSLQESVVHLLFGYVRDMIANGAELLARYDFDRLRFETVETHTPGLQSRYNDIICCIPLRGKSGDSPDDWLYMAIMLEFQQAIDWFMAHRIRLYADLLYDRVRRLPNAHRDDRLPAILPIVLYFGAQTWTAARTVDALVDPRLAPASVPETASLYSGGSYLLIDIRDLVGRNLPLENVVSLMVRTIGISDADAAHDVIADSFKLSGAQRHHFLAWFDLATRGAWLHEYQLKDEATMEQQVRDGTFRTIFNAGVLDMQEALRNEGREEGRNEGREEGRGEGRKEERYASIQRERMLLRRQVERKFGEAIAARLGGILDQIDDPDRLNIVGEHIIDYENGDDLIAELEGFA